MSKIQQVFNRINEVKAKQKTIKAMYRNALNNSVEYERVKDELKESKKKRKK